MNVQNAAMSAIFFTDYGFSVEADIFRARKYARTITMSPARADAFSKRLNDLGYERNAWNRSDAYYYSIDLNTLAALITRKSK